MLDLIPHMQSRSPDAFLSAIHPDDRDRVNAQWQRAVGSGLPLETTCRIRRRDGEYRHMAVRAIPVREGDGPVREWVGTHTDITEKIETEEQLRRTESQLLQAQRMDADERERTYGSLATFGFSNVQTAGFTAAARSRFAWSRVWSTIGGGKSASAVPCTTTQCSDR